MKKEVPTARAVEILLGRRIHSAIISSLSSVYVQLKYSKRMCTASTNSLTFREDKNTVQFSEKQSDHISEFISA
jgi:hypothetical protein